MTEAEKPGAQAEQDPSETGTDSNGGATDAPGDNGMGAESASAESSPSEADLLRGELERMQGDLARRHDALLRLQAEFENFKKRMLKEQADQLKYAQLPLLRDLAQAMDNLERALAHIRTQPGAEGKALAGGIELVAKQLGDTFERFGMVRVKTAGVAFDPTRHEAVSVVETDQAPENQVLQEFQAGYVLHDRVVRPAMVSVSKRGSAPPAGGASPADDRAQAGAAGADTAQERKPD
jgi:molecular chaperone GrpE